MRVYFLSVFPNSFSGWFCKIYKLKLFKWGKRRGLIKQYSHKCPCIEWAIFPSQYDTQLTSIFPINSWQKKLTVFTDWSHQQQSYSLHFFLSVLFVSTSALFKLTYPKICIDDVKCHEKSIVSNGHLTYVRILTHFFYRQWDSWEACRDSTRFLR